MKRKKWLLAVLPLCLLASCQKAETVSEEADSREESYVMGVSVFDPSNPEMKMFRDYYENYLTDGFPVEFIFSNALSGAEDEQAFIREAKEQGAQSIISFYGLDIQETMEVCEEEEIYFVLGSGTISDEDFEAVKENPWFLGTIGPRSEQEYEAGRDMAADFSEDGPAEYLVLTGGSSSGNYMHSERTRGILEELQDEGKLSEELDVGELAVSEKNTVLELEGGSLTLCPGYMETEEGKENLQNALDSGEYDALLCTFGVSDFLNQIREKEEAQGKNILVGAIDCFSEENYEAILQDDSFGNPQIDYVAGKYASMTGPAFAMSYNAVTGHKEANAPDGEAVRYYQGFWQAGSREEFVELYNYTQGVFDNAYSNQALLEVIKVFNPDTVPQDLQELTEAYTVEDVLERMDG